LKLALQAVKPPPASGLPKQKPTWIPKEGQPLEVMHNDKKWKYCSHCKCWNQIHITLEHKSKADINSNSQQGNQEIYGGPTVNLAANG